MLYTGMRSCSRGFTSLILVLLGNCIICETSVEKFCRYQSSSCTTRNIHESFLGESLVSSQPGHWPSSYCRITNMYMRSADKVFAIGVDNISSVDLCYGTRQIWDFASKSKEPSTMDDNIREHASPFFCDQIFDTGFVFTMYYHHGSNYFHLHYDAALPIYYLLHHYKNTGGSQWTSKNTVFMPSVEITRGKGINWDTNAFMNESTYWNALLQVLVEPYRLLPLDKRLVAMDKTLCFKEVYFGTLKFDVTKSDTVQGFGKLIKSRLHIRPPALASLKNRKHVGFIHRVGRRKILNEAQLINAIEPHADVELVDFADLSFTRQVEVVQKYDILIGMNGAGLINGLYLPVKSVVVQLIPYEAQLNYNEYKKLLKARGPYLDWRNLHSNMSRSAPGDKFNNSADTFVDVDEFVSVLDEALQLCDQ